MLSTANSPVYRDNYRICKSGIVADNTDAIRGYLLLRVSLITFLRFLSFESFFTTIILENKELVD